MNQFLRARWTPLAVAAATAMILVACNKGPAVADAAAPASDKAATASTDVATVDSAGISREELNAYTQDLLRGRPPTELTAEQKTQVLDQLITMQVLANQAVKDGADKDAATKAQLDIQRTRVLADAETQKYLKGKEPTEAELKTEYESQIASLDKTEYKARHILVKTKEEAQAAIKKIKGGAKFEDVAKAQSTDGSKAQGGDLGWFNLSRMVKPFGDAVKGLKKGEMTQEPVESQFGWHVIRLDDTRETSPPPYESVKAQVTNGLLQKKLLAYVDELKKTAKIDKKM